MPDGKQIRKNFGVYEEARAATQAYEVQALNQTNTIRLVNTRLTPGQLSEAEDAFRLLDKAAAQDARFKDLTLFQVLDFGLKNYRDPSCEVVVSDAVREFMAAKEKENRRPRTISNIRSRLNSILAQVGDKLVSQVTFHDLHSIVYDEEPHGLTQRNRLSVAKGFFNWCLRRGYCSVNPTSGISPPDYDEEEPEICPGFCWPGALARKASHELRRDQRLYLLTQPVEFGLHGGQALF